MAVLKMQKKEAEANGTKNDSSLKQEVEFREKLLNITNRVHAANNIDEILIDLIYRSFLGITSKFDIGFQERLHAIGVGAGSILAPGQSDTFQIILYCIKYCEGGFRGH